MSAPQPLPGNPLTFYVTLNGSGNGSITFGPSRVREHWQIASVGVSVATNTNEAVATVAVGSPQAPTFFSKTLTGSTGANCTMGGMDIQSGQTVTVTWTGGDAGQVATATVYGTYSIGAPS
jgi:hypothetical protein